LNAHEAYYRNEYYKREDPALRMQRLEGLGVAAFVENTILGFSGTGALYPLKTSSIPASARQQLEALLTKLDDDATSRANESPSMETKISMPTNGIVSEVVLGQCEALEPYLLERRAQDLQERALKNQLLEAQLNRMQVDSIVQPDNSIDSIEPS